MRGHIIQTNFRGGEVAPLLKGLVESGRYKGGLGICSNAIVLISGPTQRRAGTKFIDDEGDLLVKYVKFPIFRADLTPPVIQGYLVEFKADNTAHFYTNSAEITSSSITHPFTDADLTLIRYEQADDILYLVHPDFPSQTLVRTSDTTWVFTALSFTMPPNLAVAEDSDVDSITRSGSTATATQIAHGYTTGDAVRIAGAVQSEYNGEFVVTVSTVDVYTYTVSGTPATPATGTIVARKLAVCGITRSGTVATFISDIKHGFNTGHVVNVSGAGESEYNGEFIIIVTDEYTFTYTVSGSPATPATGTIKVQRLYWGATGYPAAITMFEQRVLLGGMITAPTTVIGSESGNLLNLVTGTGDSDPFEFVLKAATSAIIHLAAMDYVLVLTRDKEISLEGGVEKPLTPTNVRIKTKSGHGTLDSVRPVTISNEALFPSKHGKKLRALAYKLDLDKFSAPDISIFSSHLAALGIKEMAFQDEPNSIIWIVTDTGKLLSLTFDRDEAIIAWTQHTTSGLFKNVEVIPYQGNDQVWVAVEREIDSVTSTYTEVLDPDLNTDASFVGYDAVAKVLWDAGLDHLEGETVDILADGVVMPQDIVVGGAITLPRVANNVEVGLHYETEVEDLPPELASAVGSAQGQKVSINRARVRLYESIGCEINGDLVPFRKFGENVLDEDVPPFTGDKVVQTLGWKSGVVNIKQTQPLPLTVLAIIKEITVNG